jgi:hypothetical protein
MPRSGDGNGAFPGATCVEDWDTVTGRNVAWRVNPPGAGFSQPIVAAVNLDGTIALDTHLQRHRPDHMALYCCAHSNEDPERAHQITRQRMRKRLWKKGEICVAFA